MDYIPNQCAESGCRVVVLKPFIGHNRSAHGHQPEVMVEMLYAWIQKHNLGVIESALHLNEKLVMVSISP